MAALEQIAGRRIPSSPSTRWNFQSRTVNAVKEMREALIACCDNLSDSQSQHTGFVALGIKHTLQSPDFEFWLNFFSKIMPHVDLLYGLMQSRSIDSAFANTAIANFNHQSKNFEMRLATPVLHQTPKLTNQSVNVGAQIMFQLPYKCVTALPRNAGNVFDLKVILQLVSCFPRIICHLLKKIFLTKY